MQSHTPQFSLPLQPLASEAPPVRAHTLKQLQSKPVRKGGHCAFLNVSADIRNFKKFFYFASKCLQIRDLLHHQFCNRLQKYGFIVVISLKQALGGGFLFKK